MERIQIYQTTPLELASLIADAIRQELAELNRKVEVSQSTPVKELLTRKETAELFAVSYVTIHEWCKQNILKSYKVGNRTYFKRAEVMEVVSQSNVA